MDIFVEQLVKKKRTGKDLAKIFACLVGAFVLLFAITMGLAIPALGFFIFAVCAVFIYLLYQMVCSTKLEYEYCFTNGILDIDKIINFRSRKSMLEINVRKMEMMGTRQNRAFFANMEDRSVKKVDACTYREAEDLCFLLFRDEAGRKIMVLFNPNDEIKEGIRRYNPQKVFLNDESWN